MTAAKTVIDIEALNQADRRAFVDMLGQVFENSPWVAELAWEARPFGNVDALHHAMVAVVRRADAERRIRLLRAHPELAGRIARAGDLTAESTFEQSIAGLDRLTPEELEHFDALNAAYREKFGFPFIIAVRNHTKSSILDRFERRLAHSADTEIEAALAEVSKITRMRLDDLVAPPLDHPE